MSEERSLTAKDAKSTKEDLRRVATGAKDAKEIVRRVAKAAKAAKISIIKIKVAKTTPRAACGNVGGEDAVAARKLQPVYDPSYAVAHVHCIEVELERQAVVTGPQVAQQLGGPGGLLTAEVMQPGVPI